MSQEAVMADPEKTNDDILTDEQPRPPNDNGSEGLETFKIYNLEVHKHKFKMSRIKLHVGDVENIPGTMITFEEPYIEWLRYFNDKNHHNVLRDETGKTILKDVTSGSLPWVEDKDRDKKLKDIFTLKDWKPKDAKLMLQVVESEYLNNTDISSNYLSPQMTDIQTTKKSTKIVPLTASDIVFLIEHDILKNDLENKMFSVNGQPLFILPHCEGIYEKNTAGIPNYVEMDIDNTTNRLYPLTEKGSEPLRAELQRLCWIKHGLTCQNSPLKEAILLMQGTANKNEKIGVNRIQYLDGNLYYDMMLEKKNKIIKVTEDGWEALDDTSMMNPDDDRYVFIRYPHQLPQVMPSDTSNIELLDLYLDLQDDDKTHMLTVDTQVNFMAHIHRPLTQLEGHPDAGKSKRAQAMASLIDPQRKKNRLAPKTKNSDIIRILQQGYFIVFDNVSVITKEQSDIFAQGITGLGQDVRALYTNDDAHIYSEFIRAILLNGLTITGTETDVLTRSNKYEVKKALTNIPEEELSAKFEEDKPHILAGIFDNLSKALATVDDIKKEIEIPNEVRLQDYVFYACAVSKAMGFDPEYFLKIYLETFEDKDVLALESNPLGNILLQYMDEKAYFQGSPDQLLSELQTVIQEKKLTAPNGYPMNPKQLGEELRKIEKNLEAVGIKWTKAPNKIKNRRVYILMNTNHGDIDPDKVGIFNPNWNPSVGVTL